MKLSALFASLLGAFKSAPPPSGLAVDMARGLAGFKGEVVILLAARDRTAQAFVAAWKKNDPRVQSCPDATHSFVEPHARAWLAERVLAVLRA